MKVFMLAVAMIGLCLGGGGTRASAQTPLIEVPPKGSIHGRGGPWQNKADTAPANQGVAAHVMRTTPRHGEWVNIPAGKVKLHTWISYPDGDGKAPVVLVASNAGGMWDDFSRGVADQLAQDGFIGVVPDFVSGMGPNGGNWDSFEAVSVAVAAEQKLTESEKLNMFKAAHDYALKLPRANGRSATLGFSEGGDISFLAAALIPGLSAAIVFDGHVAPDLATMAKITAPVLYFGGELDDNDVAMVVPTAAAMAKLRKSFQYHIWAGTTGMFVEVASGENTAATLASWPLTLKFLREHMS